MAGLTPGFIQLDFSQLGASDSAGQSNYVVGGRAYFELAMFGNNTLSFVTKGFWD